MKIVEVKERNDALIQKLLEVWESSVRATHLFLSEEEIIHIKKYVPQALKAVSYLFIALNEEKSPMAFMGIEGQKLEMLFVSDKERGKGTGKELITYGIRKEQIWEVAVNEQNPLAVGFYEHMGFQVYKRTECDEQGRPYPLLYMRRIRKEEEEL